MKTISSKLTLYTKLVLLAKAFIAFVIGLLFLIYSKEFSISFIPFLVGFCFYFIGIKLKEIGIGESGEIFIKNFTNKKIISPKNIQRVSVNFLFATLYTKEETGVLQKHWFLLSFSQSLALQFEKSEQMIEKELMNQLN